MKYVRLLNSVINYQKKDRQFFIKDLQFPSCNECKFFIPCLIYPSKEKDIIRRNKCMMFGHKDMVSGEIINYYADACRNDISMCGKNGFYFEEKDKNTCR